MAEGLGVGLWAGCEDCEGLGAGAEGWDGWDGLGVLWGKGGGVLVRSNEMETEGWSPES